MVSQRHVIMFLATGGWVGRIPFAPGTLGSIIGLMVAFLFSLLNGLLATLAVTALIFGAVWIAHHAENQIGRKDPGCIVIDEIAGMCVTLLWIPITLSTAVGGFFLFRLFDIAKPPPIRYFDRNCGGGWGIVLDDVAAGIAAQVVLRLGIALFS